MSGFGDPVGRALMGRDVFRITDVTYDFEVWGSSLEQLGERALRQARDFYGNYEFRISMSVSLPTGIYQAQVRTEIV